MIPWLLLGWIAANVAFVVLAATAGWRAARHEHERAEAFADVARRRRRMELVADREQPR